MKRSAVIAAFVFSLLASAGGWYLWGPAGVPAGQPPLVSLAPANFADLQQAFNENAGKIRVVALLSPT
jgi:hypothetical protein